MMVLILQEIHQAYILIMKKIATEYSYETEEEGETILNTVNIEKLFTELQSALVRIAELEETIQTLNP